MKMSTPNCWQTWKLSISEFAAAIVETAGQAVQTAHLLLEIAEQDRKKIQQIKRVSGAALSVHHALLAHPFLSIPKAGELTGLTPPTINSAFLNLKKLGIVSEITGQKRNRMFSYDKYIAVLNEGTEPL